MPGSTPKGIPYPLSTELIKAAGTPSKLASDLTALAVGADAAVGAEGRRAELAAAASAISDATKKYGPLAGRIATTEAGLVEQGGQLGNYHSRIGALETIGGLAPGDVSDATMTSVAANFSSTFYAQLAEHVSAGSGTVNVQDYATLTDALAAAKAAGRALAIDTDIVADAVPRDLFEVPLVGKGSIAAGGDKYFVNPQHQGIQTNKIYINPTTGSNLNSGVNPTAPVKTFTQLNINLTMLREKLLDGFWEVVIQAGTHQIDTGWRMDALRTKWPLIISGEGTLGTILDGAVDTLGKAFMFKNLWTSVTFKNLKIQNYLGLSENDGYDTSAGILCQGSGAVRIENCYVLNCTTGISVGYGITAAMYGTTIEGSLARSLAGTVDTGLSVIYGASATIGASGGLGNTFIRCGTGVHVSRNSVAHVDFNTFEDNYYGMQVSHNARGAVIDGTFKRNVGGINLTGGAELTYTTAQYGTGVDANTEFNMRMGGTARLSSYQGSATSAVEYRTCLIAYNAPLVTPADTNRNPIVTFPSTAKIPANILVGGGKTIRAVLRGNATAATGTRTFELSKNTSTSTNHQVLASIIAPTGLVGSFELELCVHTLPGTPDMRFTAKLLGSAVKLDSGVLANLDKSHDWMIRVYQQNSVAADTIQIQTVELFATG